MKNKFMKLMIISLLLITHTLSGVRPASAEVIQNTWGTMPFLGYSDCTNEWVEGTIEVHLIWIFKAGKVDSIHTNVQGTAVGQLTGNRYIYKNNYKDDFSNYVCGGVATAHAYARLISQGKSPNLDTNFLITYEFDANCNPLPPNITVENSRCR